VALLVDEHPGVDVSVIVPAYRADATLSACVDALLQQRFDGSVEVVVSASADDEGSLPTLPWDERLVALRSPRRVAASTARNRAVAASRGRLLAFTDADAVPDPGWLAALVAASEGGTKAVAGAVVNGTPRSAAGTVEYLVEFLDLHPNRPVRTAWHGATVNLLVPRDLWDRFGPFTEDLEGGEDTLLSGALRGAGAFRFEPRARVVHMNRTRFLDVARHQVMFGRFTAHLGRRGPYKLRPLVRYTPLAPIAGLGRVVSIYARVLAWAPDLRRRAVVLFPLVVATLTGWTWGLLVEGLRIARSARS
jgi:glycosyltransferase involved in cell wall biosynthesis